MDQVNKSLKSQKINGPRGFIFRTRGGATQNPWEDQRVTKVYDPGTVLDARTLKIVNPKIRLDKQSVSGVAIDDAAKFTVYVGNESEKPEATDGLTVLQLFSVDQTNPQGREDQRQRTAADHRRHDRHDVFPARRRPCRWRYAPARASTTRVWSSA